MIDRALILSEKYFYSDPKQGSNPTEHFLCGSLQASRLVKKIEKFCPSEAYFLHGAEQAGAALMQICHTFQPQVLILVPNSGPFGPPRETLQRITEQTNITTLMIFGDTCNNTGERNMLSWLPSISKAAITDSFVLNRKYARKTGKVIEFFGSQIDPSIFYDRKQEKDIDVSFIGNELTHPSRLLYINYLRENNIRVFTAGPREKCPIEKYAEYLNRSKITINFSATVIGNAQFKGRVLEAMASNSLLFEDQGMETKFIFKPDQDFVIFNSKEDLLAKIRYYLNHEEERKKLSKLAHDKLTHVFNSRNAWAHAFQQMGFPLPIELEQDPHFDNFRRSIHAAYNSVPVLESAIRLYGRNRSFYLLLLQTTPPMIKFVFRFVPKSVQIRIKLFLRRILIIAYNIRYDLDEFKK